MIKFIFFIFLRLFRVLNLNLGFWLSRGLIVLSYYIFISNSFILVDYIYYGEGLGIDLVSFSLIVLRIWLTILIYFSRSSIFYSNSLYLFYIFVFMLMFTLLLTFIVTNLLMFYFFFEVTLIPTLLIILGWGYQPERLQAGVYFLFYTLAASLPLLLTIISYYKNFGGLVINFYLFNSSLRFSYFLLFIFTIIAFIVKIPIFFVHLWLPKAHVEAPVAGSIILAGVLLKLGGYGVYRVFYLLKLGVINYGGYIFGLRVLGIVYVGLICCRLSDIKALVAYSSVAHIGIVICGLISYYFWGFRGALTIIIGHGVCSSGLFCAVNIYYERSGRRGFTINKGLISILPIFTLIFFILCVINIAAPPSINLISEIFLIGGLFKFDYLMLIFFPLGSYLGALFTLFLFSYSQHGKFYEGVNSFLIRNFRETHLIVIHLIPLIIIFLNTDFFIIIY